VTPLFRPLRPDGYLYPAPIFLPVDSLESAERALTAVGG
jgi:hypothetical protein